MNRRRRSGFTLIELMIVIVIVGVLSLLAVTGFRRFSYSARNSEAHQFLGAVRAAQETYFQAFGQYCGTEQPAVWPLCEGNGCGKNGLPFEAKIDWGQPPENSPWRALGLRSPGRVWFQYKLVAGKGKPPAESFGDALPGPWFYARAHGDFDGQGKTSMFEVTSAKPDVFVDNENQ